MIVNDSVRAEIQRLKELKSKSIMLNEDDILERYMRIAFADMTDFVEWGQEEKIVIGQFGPVEYKNPVTGEKELLKENVNVVNFKDSSVIDGGLICQIKQGKDGASIKLEDRQKALDWLSKFFEMNPESKHKKEFDNKNLRLKQKQLDHNIETDKKKLEFEEKKLNTETNTEQQQEAIRNFLEATKPSKKEVEELFKDEIEKEE